MLLSSTNMSVKEVARNIGFRQDGFFITTFKEIEGVRDEKDLAKQYKIISYRLWYIITWPSAVLSSIFAFWMLFFTDLGSAWLKMPWMHVKLGFVFVLYLYHLKCQQIFGQLQRDEVKYTTNFMRLWNEVATIILFAVVFLVILKNAVNWIYGVIGIFLFSITIMLGFKFYKRIRERNSKQ